MSILDLDTITPAESAVETPGSSAKSGWSVIGSFAMGLVLLLTALAGPAAGLYALHQGAAHYDQWTDAVAATITRVTPDGSTETVTLDTSRGSEPFNRPAVLGDVVGTHVTVRVSSDGKYEERPGSTGDYIGAVALGLVGTMVLVVGIVACA